MHAYSTSFQMWTNYTVHRIDLHDSTADSTAVTSRQVGPSWFNRFFLPWWPRRGPMPWPHAALASPQNRLAIGTCGEDQEAATLLSWWRPLEVLNQWHEQQPCATTFLCVNGFNCGLFMFISFRLDMHTHVQFSTFMCILRTNGI